MTQPVAVVGLGPAGLGRVTAAIRTLVTDSNRHVVVRTIEHPAAADLAALRDVEACDDLYAASETFDGVYRAIAERVLGRAADRPVVYAVPGSAAVGERSVALLRERAREAGIDITIEPGESFLDLVWVRTGCDPIAAGAQVVDGRDLPNPLQLHLPTVITQVDRPEVLADVAVELGKVLDADTAVTILDGLGAEDECILKTTLGEMAAHPAGPRTTLFVDPPPNGWVGLVTTNRLLRKQCPWDQQQTHHTLVKHLIEETYETVEAVERLSPLAPHGDVDYGAYAELEEELGDLLLQVVFHATLAQEPGAFGVEEVAERIRRKLVSRHPHVFGDVDAADADTVNRNWEHLKSGEKDRASAMDDVPTAMPALVRADKLQRRAAALGFDWPTMSPVLAKLHEELQELELAIASDEGREVTHELGDVLFSVVNLARHAGVDAELAFRVANDRFAQRFRAVERLAAARSLDVRSQDLATLDGLWDEVKHAETRLAVYGSLAPGASNHDVIAGLEGEWRDASIRGRLRNPEWELRGGYPAFEPADGASQLDVRIFESPDLPRHWSRLDRFEGLGYQRIVIDAVRRDGTHEAVTIYAVRER